MMFRGWQKVSLMDYPGKIVTTAFTGGCNFKCPYCHNWELVENGEDLENIGVEEVLAFLDKRTTMVDGICISGGEPTLCKGLPEFISRVKELGKSVKVDTNGTNPEMIRELISGGMLDYVAMDVKCSLARYKDLTHCGDGEVDKVAETIEILKVSGIDYEFRTTLTEEYNPVADAGEIARMVEGAKRYALQKFQVPEAGSKEILRPLGRFDAEKIMETVAPFVDEIFLRGY